MNRSISGRIVACRTFSSIRTTTAPPRWIIPKIGGFSFSKVPRPRAPFRQRRRPRRLFFHCVWPPFMPGHHIDLVAFHFPGQDRVGLAGDDPLAQLLGHPLHVIHVQSQLLGNLGI
jgi:hypothetical protein